MLPRITAVLVLTGLGGGLLQADPPASVQEKQARRAKRLIQATYPVADLVVPIDAEADRPATQEERLMATIRAIVAEESWAENGGSARMEYQPIGMSLVVKQTRRNHRELAELLASLRKAQDRQIVLSLHWVTVPEKEAALFRELAGFRRHFPEDPRRAIEAAGASERQAQAWVRWLAGIKGISVVQTPRVTLFNGRSATLQCVDRREFVTAYRLADVGSEPVSTQVEVGQKAIMTPVVAGDGGKVRLHLHATTSWLEEAVEGRAVKVLRVENGVEKLGVEYVQEPQVRTSGLDKVLTIPAGTTLICSMGKKTQGKREEIGPTWFTSLPYVTKVFPTAGYTRETCELFLFVSARIVSDSEAETAPADRTVSVRR